jgi:integrase
MNIEQQSEIYIANLENRKRDPATGNTLQAYRSYLKNHIIPHLGQMDLSEIKNGAMKKFVEKLAAKQLSPASIAGVVNCVKGVIKSAVNENGDYLHPVQWNNSFIDSPPVNPRDQEGPILSREALEAALARTSGQFRTLCVLLGASGLRISEALSVKRGAVVLDDSKPGPTLWDPDKAVISVKAQIYKGLEQSPKTDAGIRQIDLCESANYYLLNFVSSEKRKDGEYLFQSKNGRPLSLPTVYGWSKKINLPGYHSFRRFRITHLRSQLIQEDLIKFWAGHSSNSSITDRYSKLAQNIDLRKEAVQKAGLGFDLPKEVQ